MKILSEVLIIKKEHIFAIYKGDKFLDLGTAKELAKKFNVTAKTIRFYSTPVHLKRIKENAFITVNTDLVNS